jgi:hypothetical protein
MIDGDALTGDFVSGQEYELEFDRAGQRWVVADSAKRSVAVLPPGLGGAVRTRTDRWIVGTERRRIGWAVVARTLPERTEAGRARESLLPYTWKVRVSPGFDFRVTENPVRCDWTLSEGGCRLVRISDSSRFATGGDRLAFQRGPAGHIRTLEAPPRLLPLPLAILLTLEMIRAEATIPNVGGGAGG